MKVLSDSSPLITLAKIGRLDLLRELYSTVTITPEVYAEVVFDGTGLAGSSAESVRPQIGSGVMGPSRNRQISLSSNNNRIRQTKCIFPQEAGV